MGGGSGSGNAEAAAQAAAFLRRVVVQGADDVVDLPFGVATFTSALPRVYDFNLVWVDDAHGQVDLVAAETERLFAERRLGHREVIVPGEESARLLAPALRRRRYEAQRRVVMALRRAPGVAARQEAREIGLAGAIELTEQSLRRMEQPFDDETIAQLCSTKEIAASIGCRFVGAVVDGAVVSGCDLYSDGRTAQIESVITLDEHRGKGYATAVVLHAIEEARAAGNGLVFLQADEDDWPRDLYAKLGFDVVGSATRFLRPPGTGRRSGPSA